MTKIQHGLPSSSPRKDTNLNPSEKKAYTAHSPRISFRMVAARNHGLVSYHIWEARSKNQLIAIGSVHLCSRNRMTLQLQQFLRPGVSALQYTENKKHSTSWRFLEPRVQCNVTLIQSMISDKDCFCYHIYF